jgi:hypothetical protein
VKRNREEEYEGQEERKKNTNKKIYREKEGNAV